MVVASDGVIGLSRPIGSTQVQDIELIYEVGHPDGREERLVRSLRMRYLFRFEAEHLWSRCGFQVEKSLYADYDKGP